MRRRRLTRIFPNEFLRRRYVEKADVVRYGPHPKVNYADIWHRRDLPRDGKAPVLLQVPGGAWSIGMRRPQAYPMMSHFAERGWVCAVCRSTTELSPYTPGRTTSSTSNARWPGSSRTSPITVATPTRRHHRWFGRRASLRAGRPDARRSAVSAGFRGRRHVCGGGRSDLRAVMIGEDVQEAVERLKKNKNVLIGGNIGKNKLTPNENAVDDYLICFDALFDYVDYFVVNVSSPNTPNLRELQEKEPLTQLLQTLQNKNMAKPKAKPILLKIAPDLTNEQLLDIIDIVNETKIAGVIATNTTISRDGLESDNKTEMGGLSGKPLTKRSTEVIRFLSEKSNKAFPIIGVGGIHSADDAIEKLEAGASLIQLYTGFIYEGPALVKAINKKILEKL